jgi:excisionase family DNA binding protein
MTSNFGPPFRRYTLANMSVAELLNGGTMTLDAASKWASVSKTALYDAMKANELAYVMNGRRRLIIRESLKAWLLARIAPCGTD